MSANQSIRRSFDKYEKSGAYHWKECERWSKAFNPPLVARYKVVTDLVDKSSNILEIGAGDGCLTASLAGLGASVTGVEIDASAVRLAYNALKGIDNCAIAQADCYQLPFPPGVFDIVVMADVVEHLVEPEKALAEAVRVMKPHGFFVLTTPKWRPDRMWDTHHVREYKTSELRDCLNQFFKHIDIEFFWPLFWSKIYSTKLGWHALRIYARYISNPFLKVGSQEASFGQILAVCRIPAKKSSEPKSIASMA